MTGRPPRTNSASRRVGRRLVLAAVSAGAAVIIAACGADYYEIPIETPIQPKLDVSAFQRVLVAGFVAGGSEDVDANQETVRLLRSQLRTKSSLKVIDADILPLFDVAQDQAQPAADDTCLRQFYPADQQLAFGMQVIKRYGYDFERGRQDLTHHPYMTKFALGDVRITTRVSRSR